MIKYDIFNYKIMNGVLYNMPTDPKKYYGTYKGFIVEGNGRELSQSYAPLSIPSKNDDELSNWMRFAKMLAKSRYAGIWGAEEKEELA